MFISMAFKEPLMISCSYVSYWTVTLEKFIKFIEKQSWDGSHFSRPINSTKNDSAAVLMGRDRSSHQRCSLIKDVLRNFTKFTGQHLSQSLFFSIKKMYTNNILKNNFGAEYLTVFKKSIKTNQFHLLNVIQKLNRC